MSSRHSPSVSTTGTGWSDSSRAAGAADKEQFVHALFDGISPQYDRFNRLASFGLDQGWRRRAVAEARLRPGMRVLDLGAGTGDLALAAAEAVSPTGLVAALDFSIPMLRLAARKAAASPAGYHLHGVAGRAEQLPLPDGTFDAVISGFVMRNVSDLGRTVAEARRVLAPGGRLVILEFGRPRAAVLRWGHRVWLGAGVPALGWLATGARGPFTYLRRSIAGFLAPEQFIAQLQAAGFVTIEAISLMGGAVVIYKAVAAGDAAWPPAGGGDGL